MFNKHYNFYIQIFIILEKLNLYYIWILSKLVIKRLTNSNSYKRDTMFKSLLLPMKPYNKGDHQKA